jgi:phosphoribosyl 1,2-cyclic phosphodiesterase
VPARATIRFLGTGGARFVVARQFRASGGMWMRFGATQLHVDPGPGALVRALESVPPCEPRELDAIVLSHKHLDHSNDVNAMIEAMTAGGFRPRGALLAPRDAFEGDPVILPYAARFVPVRHVLVERGGPYRVGDVEIRASVRHRHAVDTFGLHLRWRDLTISYLPCGRFFDGLVEDYAAHAPDVLVLNVLFYRESLRADHLTLDDARALIAGIRPRVAVLTHFGTKMLERDPPTLARVLEDELGIRVHAAYDGWTLDATNEVAAAIGEIEVS